MLQMLTIPVVKSRQIFKEMDRFIEIDPQRRWHCIFEKKALDSSGKFVETAGSYLFRFANVIFFAFFYWFLRSFIFNEGPKSWLVLTISKHKIFRKGPCKWVWDLAPGFVWSKTRFYLLVSSKKIASRASINRVILYFRGKPMNFVSELPTCQYITQHNKIKEASAWRIMLLCISAFD